MHSLRQKRTRHHNRTPFPLPPPQLYASPPQQLMPDGNICGTKLLIAVFVECRTSVASSVISEFSRIPTSRQREFWNVPKIQHLRRLAETGSAVRLWTPLEELTRRPLDRVRFTGVGYDGKGGDLSGYAYSNANRAVDLAYGRISLTSPLYLGDMSYGALSGVANIAIARAADVTGVIAGTGEGGLHPDVAKCKRITV